MDGVVPFLIDWGTSPHPTDEEETEVTFVELKGYHPQPDKANQLMDALGLGMRIEQGDTPKLELHLDTPKGRVVLS